MLEYLFTYEILSRGEKVYEAFAKSALFYKLTYVIYGSRNLLFRLPEATVWGVFHNEKDAASAFDCAVKLAQISIEERIEVRKRTIVRVADGDVISDEHKLADPRWTGSSLLDTCIAHQENDPFFAY